MLSPRLLLPPRLPPQLLGTNQPLLSVVLSLLLRPKVLWSLLLPMLLLPMLPMLLLSHLLTRTLLEPVLLHVLEFVQHCCGAWLQPVPCCLAARSDGVLDELIEFRQGGLHVCSLLSSRLLQGVKERSCESKV
jgi:hypothetical protein